VFTKQLYNRDNAGDRRVNHHPIALASPKKGLLLASDQNLPAFLTQLCYLLFNGNYLGGPEHDARLNCASCLLPIPPHCAFP